MSFREGQLSSSQRQAVIVLIEKKDKDKRFLKNWRPTSLINVDAKIVSKAIALRIKKVQWKFSSLWSDSLCVQKEYRGISSFD